MQGATSGKGEDSPPPHSMLWSNDVPTKACKKNESYLNIQCLPNYIDDEKNQRYRRTRSAYGLTKCTQLKHVDFWEDLFDALRAFDDDCTLLERKWQQHRAMNDTSLFRCKWRRQMSVAFCRYYRRRIVELLTLDHQRQLGLKQLTQQLNILAAFLETNM